MHFVAQCQDAYAKTQQIPQKKCGCLQHLPLELNLDGLLPEA